MANPAWHHVLKFIITGDSAIGKSSLLVRLMDQGILANPNPTVSTPSCCDSDHRLSYLDISMLTNLDRSSPDPDATVVKLHTTGMESFHSIKGSYYRGAAGAGFLLVHDVASRRSWLADVRILGGNKIDLCEGD
ncbi:hypothetical protein C8R43DRAFT_830752, partial [Mycena crocata]